MGRSEISHAISDAGLNSGRKQFVCFWLRQTHWRVGFLIRPDHIGDILYNTERSE